MDLTKAKKYFMDRTKLLAATIYLIFSAGAFYGVFATTTSITEYLLIIPLVIALVAYYSKTFAVLSTVVFLAFILI